MTENNRFTKALGRNDQGVMTLISTIGGRVCDGWSGDEITEGAHEASAETTRKEGD